MSIYLSIHLSIHPSIHLSIYLSIYLVWFEIAAQVILMDQQASQTVSHTHYKDITPYTTKDGSIIRELMHPSIHGNVNQSFAEAEVPVGECTFLHVHEKSEEIYHITAGEGMMSLGGREFQVRE